MRKVLVTGAGGFIGKPLVRSLRTLGHQVLEHTRAVGDICETPTLLQYGSERVEHVFHLAGKTYVPDAWLDPLEFQRVNVIGTLNVLEFCRRQGCSLTFISAYLYGVPDALPIKETAKVAPNNPYALSKYLAEEACRFYAEHFGMRIAIVRPFNIYGPGQKGHFLIPEILAQVKSGRSITLKDLAPRRDYLYLDDLIDALVRTLDPKPGCQIYNIGYGSSLSVAEIVEAIQAVAGTALQVINESIPRKNEIPDVYADFSRARNELHWQPQCSFEEGIKKIFLSEESQA